MHRMCISPFTLFVFCVKLFAQRTTFMSVANHFRSRGEPFT